MKTRPRAGITLIEVLIAMSLLSFLSAGMLLAMRIGFNTMDRTDAHLIQNRKVANVRKIVEDEIAGFTFTRADWRPEPQSTIPVPFMQFEPASMRFVTGYSLRDAWRGRPQIAALQVIPGEGNVGVRLIVNETPYTGALQAGLFVEGIESGPLGQVVRFVPIHADSNSFVLADKLEYCRFSYLEPQFEPPFQIWRPDWVRADLPLGIRIEMEPLNHTPAEIQMSTVTVSMPVNRATNLWYYDADQ
jgi:hypothetical protein